MSDLRVGAAWGAVTVFLFFVCWKLAGAVRPRDNLYQKALHAIILCWAMIVAVVVVLGVVNHLTGGLLLLTVAVVSAGLLAALRMLPHIYQQDSACIAEATKVVAPETSSETRTQLVEATLWIFLLSFWAYHVVSNGLLQFPDDFDSLMYHLPLIDHWLQAHSLYAPDAWKWSTSGNNEVLGLWCAAPFSWDFLVALCNVPAIVVLVLASRELASLFGLDRLAASVCGMAVTANYVILKQLVDTENDVAVAALTVASVAYALRYARSGGWADLALSGISLGLLSGIKFYALGYAVLAWLVLLGSTVICRGLRSGVKAGFIAGVLALGWGGYWYVRNWLLTGTPLYPKRLFTAHDELAQYYPDVWRSAFVGNGSPELFPLAVEAIRKMAGPLHLAAFYCLPVVVPWLIVSGVVLWHKPSGRCAGVVRITTGCLVVAACLVLLCTPFAVEDDPGTLNHLKWAYTPVRYGMSFLSLTVIVFSVFLVEGAKTIVYRLKTWQSTHAAASLAGGCAERNGRWKDVVGWCLMATPCLLLLGFSGYQIMACAPKFMGGLTEHALFAIDGVLVGAIVASFGWLIVRRRLLLAFLAGVVFIVGIAVATATLSERWHAGFARYYDLMFEQGLFTSLAAVENAPERICVLDFRPYPFFGSRRQHYVCQPHRPSAAADFYDFLLDHRVTLVVGRFDFDLRSRGWEKCSCYLSQKPDIFVSAKDSPWPYTMFLVSSSRLPSEAARSGEVAEQDADTKQETRRLPATLRGKSAVPGP
ncbi:MAG: hypothetical protein ACRELG_15390 [Gemmataceae bacterium]